MKSKNIILICMIMSLSLTGCWDARELNNLLIISGIAIDKGPGHNIMLSIISLRPEGNSAINSSENNKLSNRAFIISQQGKDVADAYSKMTMKLSRDIFLSQLQVIVIGEKVASNGVKNVLDFFPRQHETRLRVFVMVTKGKALNLFKVNPELNISIVDEIKKLKELNIGTRMQMKDFMYMLTEEGINPSIPLIQRIKRKGTAKSVNEQSIAMTGGAIFKKDVLIGWMNMNQYLGVLWVQDKIKRGSITSLVAKRKGGGYVTGDLLAEKSNIIPVIKNNKVEIQIYLHAEVNISENESILDLGNPKDVNYSEKLFEKEVTKLVNNSIHVAQKHFKSDIFGFGAVVHGEYPKQWDKKFKKSWDKEFPNLKVKVFTNVHVHEVGHDTKSSTKSDEIYKK